MAKKPTSSSHSDKKKTAASAASAPKKKAAAPKAPSKSAGAGAGGAGTSPLIDTNLAANAAAAFVGNKLSRNNPSGAKQESAGFKNLKQKLAKPSQGLGSILDTTNQNKKPNLPFGGGKQVAHNQTFGADVNRAGVPRRTPG
jgi:hypothetical protein